MAIWHHCADYQWVFFRPDGIGTVTVEEKERFEEIKERLRVLLENQITHFRLEPSCRNDRQLLSQLPQSLFSSDRYCFPFGRPEGALKATLSLLERVSLRFLIASHQLSTLHH